MFQFAIGIALCVWPETVKQYFLLKQLYETGLSTVPHIPTLYAIFSNVSFAISTMVPSLKMGHNGSESAL